MKALRSIQKHMHIIWREHMWLILLGGVMIFLYFWRFEEFATFLGDQGRDAIIVKRIATLEHLTLIGPPTSIGNVFLGPFFYYLMAPFLLLFQFNPAGMVFGVGLLSLIGLVLAYVMIYKEINKETALLFVICMGLSSTMINFARFAWNPNLLPIFAFFTLATYAKAFEEKDIRYAILSGALLAFSIQLHYLALFLLAPLSITTGVELFRAYQKKQKVKKECSFVTPWIKPLIAFVIATIVCYSPLILFDLRHNFINAQSFVKTFQEPEIVNTDEQITHIERISNTVVNLIQHVTTIETPFVIAGLLTILILAAGYYATRKYNKPFVYIHLANAVGYIILFSVLNSQHHPHYYGAVYGSVFFLVTLGITLVQEYLYILMKEKTKRVYLAEFASWSMVGIVIVIYVAINMHRMQYIFGPAMYQIKRADNIALSIIPHIQEMPIQVVPLPTGETDGYVRYFLEIRGYRPLPDDTIEQPKELYALCFRQPCTPLSSGQWQIAAMQHKKEVGKWTYQEITIHKIVNKD